MKISNLLIRLEGKSGIESSYYHERFMKEMRKYAGRFLRLEVFGLDFLIPCLQLRGAKTERASIELETTFLSSVHAHYDDFPLNAIKLNMHPLGILTTY